MAKLKRKKSTTAKRKPLLDEKYERLAELKSIIKSLEEEASVIQKEILDSDFMVEKYDTEYGTLCYRTKENWGIGDKKGITEAMGIDDYIEYSTITKAKIKECLGDKGVAELEASGALEIKYVSKFFQLVVPKK